jgi:O-antigen ligase
MTGFPVPAGRHHPGVLALWGTLLAALLLLAFWIGRAPLPLPMGAAAAAAIFLVVLVSAEAGLVLLVLSMLLSPEIPLAGLGGSDLEGSRSVVLRADDLVLLIVGLGWLARLAIQKDLGTIRRTSLNLPIVAWILACTAATFLGIGAGRVRPVLGICFLLKYVEYVLVFFITVNYVRSEDRLRRVLVAVLLTATAIAGWAFVQMPSGQRPSAPFEGTPGEPNTLGGYLVLMFCVATGIAVARPGGTWVRWCGLLAMSLIPPILATLSRGSWVALAGALLAFLLLAPRRRGLTAAVLAGAALLVMVPPQAVADRVAGTFEAASEATPVGPIHLDESSSARLQSWGTAVNGWLQHPVAGWGVTGYGFIDAQYFRLLVETGLLGIVAFGWLVMAQGRLFLSVYRSARRPLHRGLAIGLCAGLAGLLAHGVSTNTFMLIRIMEPYWLLAGLVATIPTLEVSA